MLRLTICLSAFIGSLAMATSPIIETKKDLHKPATAVVAPAPTPKDSTKPKTKPVIARVQPLAIKVRYSSKSWNTPEEVIPPDAYDIPGDKRAPNSGTDVDLGIDELFGNNKDVPDYGAAFKAD